MQFSCIIVFFPLNIGISEPCWDFPKLKTALPALLAEGCTTKWNSAAQKASYTEIMNDRYMARLKRV